MRKQLIATLLLACGAAYVPASVMAVAEPAQQSQTVSVINGTILDENNEPCIGASVQEKGNSSNAAITDAFGHFQLRVKPGATLVISYVGYKTVDAKATADMTIYMEPTTASLEQVVVVGYGSQKKANLTGAVSTVDVARVMDSRPVQDVTKALQGAVPGLTITNSQGGVNSTASIKIRGIGSLSGSVEPLIVVDGVPTENLDFINPNDIEEISVLKDAASTSIYGTRAAFGVILITTKYPAKQDKVSVHYTNNFGWAQATVMPEMASNVDQMEAQLQSAYRSGASGQLKTEVGGMSIEALLPYARKWAEQHNGPYRSYREVMPYVDENNVGDYRILDDGTWLRYAEWNVGKTLFTSSAPQQKHNVSIEGTSGRTQYRMSFGYDSKQNLNRYNPDKMKRYMANINLTTEITKWLKAGVRASFTQRDVEVPNLDRNSYQYLWRWPSYMEFYGWKENDYGDKVSFRNDIGNRKFAHIDHFRDRRARIQAFIKADILPGLTLDADFTYDMRYAHGKQAWTYNQYWNTWTATAFTLYQQPSGGQPSTYARKTFDDNSIWTFNVFATYKKTFAEDHNLKVMLGSSAERGEYSYFTAQRNGLLDYNLIDLSLTDGGLEGTQLTINNSDSHYATAGWFGRINYDYKGIYLFEANGRYDGSSKFPAKDQWAFFPSFSAGYRFSEEAYFKNLKNIVSNGKLRASYGHVGNQAVGNNRFISTISKPAKINWIDANGNTVFASNMPTLVSSSLTWERVITTDIGLDLGFLDNSLNLTFDWFSRETRDMLMRGAELPQTLGASAPYENAGRMRSNGWELAINWNHSFGDADVFASFTIADAKTKLTKWQQSSILYSYNPEGYGGFYSGMTYGDIWGLEFDRYFTEDDFVGKDEKGNWIPKDGIATQDAIRSGTFRFGPGDVKFKDLDGNGVINGGVSGRLRYQGKIYDPGDADYDRIKALQKDPTSGVESIGVGTKDNHGDFKVIGNGLPRYEYSFRLGGAWKGFDLDVFFQGVGKRKMWVMNSQVIPFAQFTGAIYDYQLDCNRYIFDDNHKIVGYEIDQSNMYPNLYAGCFSSAPSAFRSMAMQGVNNFTINNRYLTDMSYLRVKNITLGYTLPYDLTKKAWIEKARFYVSVENPCFIHNGAGKYDMDPEISTGEGGQGTGSFGRTNMFTRVYSFGVQVTF